MILTIRSSFCSNTSLNEPIKFKLLLPMNLKCSEVEIRNQGCNKWNGVFLRTCTFVSRGRLKVVARKSRIALPQKSKLAPNENRDCANSEM